MRVARCGSLATVVGGRDYLAFPCRREMILRIVSCAFDGHSHIILDDWDWCSKGRRTLKYACGEQHVFLSLQQVSLEREAASFANPSCNHLPQTGVFRSTRAHEHHNRKPWARNNVESTRCRPHPHKLKYLFEISRYRVRFGDYWAHGPPIQWIGLSGMYE